MKLKVFDGISWAALLSSLARIKGTADANASAVSELRKDFTEMSNDLKYLSDNAATIDQVNTAIQNAITSTIEESY